MAHHQWGADQNPPVDQYMLAIWVIQNRLRGDTTEILLIFN